MSYKIPKTVIDYADVIDEAGNDLGRVVKRTTQSWLEAPSSKGALVVAQQATRSNFARVLSRIAPLTRVIDAYDAGKWLGERLAELLAPLYIDEDNILVIIPPESSGAPSVTPDSDWVYDPYTPNLPVPPYTYNGNCPLGGHSGFISYPALGARCGMDTGDPVNDVYETRDGTIWPTVNGHAHDGGTFWRIATYHDVKDVPGDDDKRIYFSGNWTLDKTFAPTEADAIAKIIVIAPSPDVPPVVPAEPEYDPIAPYLPDVAPIININVNWRAAPVFRPARLPLNRNLPANQQHRYTYQDVSLDTDTPQSPALPPDGVELDQDTVVIYPSSFPPPRAGDEASTRFHRQIPRGVRNTQGVKERKVKLPGSYKILNKGLSLVTEGLEIIDILYDAIPDRFKPAYREYRYWDKKLRKYVDVRIPRSKNALSPQQKLDVIYAGYDHIDLDAVAKGLADNYVEDAVYGLLGQGVAANNRALGDLGLRTSGMQRGAAERRYGSMQARTTAARKSRQQREDARHQRILTQKQKRANAQNR